MSCVKKKKVKIRFFGSSDCKDCLEVFVILEKSQVDYKYIDTDDDRDEIQDFCDEQNVNQLPHLQFLNNDSHLIVEHIGSINEEEFHLYLIKYFPDY